LSLKCLDLLLKRFNRLFTYHHEKPPLLSPDSSWRVLARGLRVLLLTTLDQRCAPL
jgi:hypothetical protein